MGKVSAHSLPLFQNSLFYGNVSANLKIYFQLCEQILIAAGTAYS